MLIDEWRKTLLERMDDNPKAVLKELEQNPQLLKALLTNQEAERNERVKYIQMNAQMQEQLRERSEQLKMSQGLLIGLGLLWFLSKLNER